MTPKQEAFVHEYLVDLNSTAAAIRAGYSPRTANQQGPALLVKLGAQIAEAKAARVTATKTDAEWVLRRLIEDATADLADLYDANGHLRPVKEWPMTWRTGLVAGIETALERDGTDGDGKPQYVEVRKVKLADRTRLVELLGKHIGVGAFKERIEHSGEVTISDRLKRAEERAAGK
jgi:phage terminase small subunit